MKIIVKILFMALPLMASGQTVFGYAIDTVIVSGGDSITVIDGGGRVLSVGDTVSVWFWAASDDSVRWDTLLDDYGNVVTADSVCIDTLRAFKYYCAVLTGFNPECIVWWVDNVVYKRLRPPDVTDDAGIGKTSILLIRLDSVRLQASFMDLQPDRVVWYREYPAGRPSIISPAGMTSPLIAINCLYYAVGYLYDRQGVVIDSAYSAVYDIQFKQPLDMVVFRSWAGSNDGRPRVDTLVVDTCRPEMLVDTLWFEYGNPYRYQFVPVISAYDKAYTFTYRWIYDGFASVIQRDSILEFDPLRAEHTGSYVFVVTRWLNGRAQIQYRSRPVVITACAINSVNNEELTMNNYFVNGTVYSVTGAVVRTGLSGSYMDIVRNLNIPSGVYFLRDMKHDEGINRIYKIIK